jgi:hypothetical protein
MTTATKVEDSAVLIINDSQSAMGVLQVIAQYARVFAQHPIRILRGDRAHDRELILTFTKKCKISAVPALITRGAIVIGSTKICEFIPRLAHSINTHVEREKLPAEEVLREHQLQQMDDMGADDEEKVFTKDEMDARISQYRREMDARGAVILCGSAEKAPPSRAKVASTPSAPPSRNPPPPMRVPAIPKSSGGGSNDDIFVRRYTEMIEETTDD